MNRGILAKQTEDAAVRQMASDNDLPHDQLREVLQRAPKDDDDDTSSTVTDDDFGGGGGDGGGGGGDGGGGRNLGERIGDMKNTVEWGQPPDYSGTMDFWKRGGGGGASGSSPAASASNLQVMAQLEELRREMRQQQKQEIIVHNMPQAPTNPIKEIIREIHQVHVPQPAPQPPQSEDTARLIAALGQAVAQNQNLVGFAQKMGLSMDQLVALLRAQLKRPVFASRAATTTTIGRLWAGQSSPEEARGVPDRICWAGCV